jgi:hypothetical protein
MTSTRCLAPADELIPEREIPKLFWRFHT